MARRPSIRAAVNQLPKSDITTTVLNGLDFIVPGEWQNITSFDEMIRLQTGVQDPRMVNAIGLQADRMFASRKHYYHSAHRVYSVVDTLDKAVAAAALANKVGNSFQFASFLNRFTPKADTTQSIDAGLKFVAEIIAFAMLNGLPSPNLESLGQFSGNLKNYAKDDIMRLTAWIVIDGMIPLGPNFMRKIAEQIQGNGSSIQNNAIFGKIAGFLPGSSATEKSNFIVRGISSATGWVENFVAEKGITREGVGSSLLRYVDVADNSLDYLGAALDGTTNYFRHTGTQTVARTVIRDAHKYLQEHPQAVAQLTGGGGAAGGAGGGRKKRRGLGGVGTALAVGGAVAAGAAAVAVFSGDDDEPRRQRRRQRPDDYEYNDRFSNYSEEDFDGAIVDALCLAAWADGEVSEDEQSLIADLVGQLPAFQGYGVQQAVRSAFGRLQHQGYDEALANTTQVLAGSGMEEDAYVLAAMVQYADGVADGNEEVFLSDLAGALGIAEYDADALLYEAEEQMAAAGYFDDYYEEDEEYYGEDYDDEYADDDYYDLDDDEEYAEAGGAYYEDDGEYYEEDGDEYYEEDGDDYDFEEGDGEYYEEDDDEYSTDDYYE